MSGEDNNTNNISAMDQVMAMLNTMNNNINESKNDINSLKIDIKNEITSNNQSINDKFDIIQDKFESMQAENAATREELISRIDTRSRVSTRAPSRATSSKQLALGHAVILTATIPVVTVPIIVTVLKTPPLCFAVPDNEIITTHMEPILSVTNITVLESPQQPLETLIEVPVRTTTAPYDVTPPFKSNHASEAVPTDDSPNMDADDFYDQHVNSTHQPEQPCFTFNSDNSNCTSTQVPSDNSRRIGIDVSYESEQDDLNDFNNQRNNSTSYSDWGTVHVPMTMVLVS